MGRVVLGLSIAVFEDEDFDAAKAASEVVGAFLARTLPEPSSLQHRGGNHRSPPMIRSGTAGN
jgi:hypothetical protein